VPFGDDQGSSGTRRAPSALCGDRLRVLATGCACPASHETDAPLVGALDERCRALLRLAAVLTTGGGPATFERHVADALAAGAGADDLVDVLIEVAPTLGMARLVPATVELAAALGYDLDEAFEQASRPGGTAGGFSVGA
jgi:alkylhydroperoxidase/carboxymuconolactone decarboxylase family protein YurZ